MGNEPDNITRRRLLQAGAATGLGLALPGLAGAAINASCADVICRPIPSSGEMLPVAGIGTNLFGQAGVATAKELLERMYELGGRVIDTAAVYGDSEAVIGQALRELDLQDEMYLATKFNAARPGRPDEVSAADSFKRSLERLQVQQVDLLFIHFIDDVEALMPLMLDLKEKGRVRHVGITSVQRAQHPQVMRYMRDYPIDFLQIDYSLGNRDTATDVLPLAMEREIAVMVAVPFGGRRSSLFAQAGDHRVPDWAAEFGATSWGQFFLKYIVSHPAVTCVIPGTTDVKHLEDNLAAGSGELPDEATCRRMESFWDGLG